MRYDWDIERHEWEEDGYTIGEHTGSPPVDWDIVNKIVIHYPADPSINEDESFVDHLRASQRYYIASRGYSYGYNAVVWDGISAEVRGDDYRCAANGNTALNRDAFAIQIRVEGLTGDADPASAADIAEVRDIIAWAQRRAGRLLSVVGHRDLKPTGCPGDAIYAQVISGAFRPLPEPEGPTMRYFKFDADPPLFASGDGLTAVWLDAPQWRKLVALGLADPDQIELLDRAEAVRYTLIGPAPQGYGGIWGNSDRV